MSRRVIYGILAATIAIGVFSAWYSYVYLKPLTMKEEFEGGFGEWIAEGDVPLDPNNPGHTVEWGITRATDVARSGQYSLKFSVDGRQDDGTIWIERRIAVKRNSQIQAKVSFEFYSEQESFNTIAAVCAYAGVRPPETEGDFAVIAPANEVAGWKKYTHATTIDTGSSEELWVAVGISVRWETYLTYFIDDVEITIQ